MCNTTTMNTLKLLNITDQYPSADGVYHLAYYHPPKAGEQDQISKYLLDFGDGQEPQTTQWIRLAAILVSQSLSFDVIIHPLPANDFVAKKPSSLEKLCVAISRKSGARYQRAQLQRTKGVLLDAFGSPSARPTEGPDTYEFSGEFSSSATRVLVVDDFVVNEQTLTAITQSVRAKLPQAKVLFFALGRIEENEENTHLDVSYFTSTLSPMPSSEGGVKVGASGRREPRKPLPAVPPSRSITLARPVPRPPASRTRVKERVGVWSVILIMISGIALLSGGYMLFAKRLPATDAGFYQVAATRASAREVVPPVDPAPPSPKEARIDDGPGSGPVGIVTVPSAGLRAEHFVDAKVLKATVRKGEKVSLLRKVSSSTGPRWVQIRTKGGKVGWVWASVIRELKPRVIAAR